MNIGSVWALFIFLFDGDNGDNDGDALRVKVERMW